MALLGCSDIDKMSRTLLAMSSSPANCDMMRGSRCIPLLVQLLHLDPAHPANPRPARPVRARAARSLHNIVHAHPTDKHCKREAKVLKLLEVLRQYSDFLRDVLEAVRRGVTVFPITCILITVENCKTIDLEKSDLNFTGCWQWRR